MAPPGWAAIAGGPAVTGHVEALKNSDGTLTGAFVVVTDTGTSISAQKYTAAGTADGAAVPIVAAGNKFDVDHDMNVTALKDGGYVVAFAAKSFNLDGSVQDNGDIFVKAIHGNGDVGDPIRINADAPIDGFEANQDTVVISENSVTAAYPSPGMTGRRRTV